MGKLLSVSRGSRGEGNMGCIFLILLIVAGGYVAYRFAIPYYEYSSFEGGVAEMMPYYKNHTPEYIQQAVIDIAKEYKLVLKPEQVKVTVDRKANKITIDIEYRKDVKFPYYTYTYVFKPHLTGAVY